MGNEFAATTEWNYKSELPWELLQFEPHSKMKACVSDLCHLLRNEPALYQKQFQPEGFGWVDLNHRAESVIAYRRTGNDHKNDLLIILNMTPEIRRNWKVRAYGKENWKEIFNSDAKKYWGTGDVYNPEPRVELVDKKGRIFEINVHLPALGAIVLK
jgi:1,4-alpha-glucan branching enzyme